MKIKDLLKTQKQWVQETYSKNETGISCSPIDSAAVSWCLAGALRRCYPNSIDRLIIGAKILECINTKKKYAGIIIWNDDPERTFTQVKSLLNKLDI